VQFFRDQDIPLMMSTSEFARPIRIGTVDGVCIPDLEEQAFQTGDQPNAEVVIPVSSVLVQTSAFPGAQIDDPIVFDGMSYTVRERLRVKDGALTRILLGDGGTVVIDTDGGDFAGGQVGVLDGGDFAGGQVGDVDGGAF
jgi:hypothetical protein